jgi:AMP-binding enzyme
VNARQVPVAGRSPNADAADAAAVDEDRVTSVLAGAGVGRADRVAVALTNSVWWPAAALGVWRAGAALVPLSSLWSAPRELLEAVNGRVAHYKRLHDITLVDELPRLPSG